MMEPNRDYALCKGSERRNTYAVRGSAPRP